MTITGLELPQPVAASDMNPPRPLPEVARTVAELDAAMLPEAIWRFVADTADRQQSPADFVAIAGLCALSGVIGRKVMIQPKRKDTDWRIVPNLWGALIGSPSAMKTPTLKAAVQPLNALEAAARKDFEASKLGSDTDAALCALDAERFRKEAKAAGADQTKARHFMELALSAEAASKDDAVVRRLIVQDSSVEKLGELLNENPNGLTVVRDELSGWLSRLNAVDAGAERAFYLEAFNGDGGYTYDRIGRGTIHIESVTVAVIGGIQPSKLAPLVRGAANGQADDGLIQRLQLAVWPDLSKDWAWRDRAPCPRAKADYNDLFTRLDGLPRFDPANPEAAPMMRLDDAALGLFEEWSVDLNGEVRSSRDISSSLEAHLMKMPQTVIRLAGIFAMIDKGEAVTQNNMLRALALSEYLRTHAEKIYGLAVDSPIESAKLILQRRDKLPEVFNARDVQRKGWSGISTATDASEALSVLVEHGWLIAETANTTDVGGRPTVAYRFMEVRS